MVLALEVLSLALFVGLVGLVIYCAAIGDVLVAAVCAIWAVIIGIYRVLGWDER